MTSTLPSPLRLDPSTASSPSAAQAPPPKPAAPPVSILPTQAARVYSFIHPALLLILLVARFQSLVADPVKELGNAVPVLAVLQVGYVTVCLPPAGSSAASSSSGADGSGSGSEKRGSASGKAARIGLRRKQQRGDSISAKVVPALISLTLTTLLAIPVLTILLILFGAPMTTHHPQTLLCAAHMAILSSTALVYAHGVDGSTWREVWGVNRPGDAVWGGALGTGVGAWFGAVPIPLDWDRPWQAYPITILTGAYIGYAVGSLIGRIPGVYGKRVQFVPEPEAEGQGDGAAAGDVVGEGKKVD